MQYHSALIFGSIQSTTTSTTIKGLMLVKRKFGSKFQYEQSDDGFYASMRFQNI